MEGDTRPVKVRLAEKHGRQTAEARRLGENTADISDVARDAYLAGFERGKALAVDYVMRFVDPKAAEEMRKLVGEG